MKTFKVVILRRSSQFSEWREFKTDEIKAKTIGSAINKARKIYESPYCTIGRVYDKEA